MVDSVTPTVVFDWFGLAKLFLEFLTLGAAVWLGILFYHRNKIFDKRTNVESTRAEDERQTHMTDRINAAVANIGALYGDNLEKPNIEVRIGGIYALERISQDSARDHVQMMEILTAYVRQNAPASSAVDIPEQEEGEEEWEYRTRIVKKIPPPRADIQIAIDVLARRGRIEQEQWYTLDLRNTNLQRIFVAARDNLNYARFNNAQLAEADFTEAQLQCADFWQAQLQWANFMQAQLEGAFFREAQLAGAVFWLAWLGGANFTDAQLQGADFREAQLQGADFREAQLQRVLFKDNDLSETKELTQNQLQQSFGDGSVKLPDGLMRPNHWPQEKLNWDYLDKYKQWLQATYPDLYKQRFGQ